MKLKTWVPSAIEVTRQEQVDVIENGSRCYIGTDDTRDRYLHKDPGGGCHVIVDDSGGSNTEDLLKNFKLYFINEKTEI